MVIKSTTNILIMAIMPVIFFMFSFEAFGSVSSSKVFKKTNNPINTVNNTKISLVHH